MALEIKVNQKKEEGIKGKIYTRLRYYKQTNNLKKKKQFANGFEDHLPINALTSKGIMMCHI